VKINTSPVEAYRQVGNLTENKKNIGHKDELSTDRTSGQENITLPASRQTEAESIKVVKSPSLLRGVLSSEEEDTLFRYFARFGDSQESSQIYSTDARAKNQTATGIRVDLKG
jgi:hypothetical protein